MVHRLPQLIFSIYIVNLSISTNGVVSPSSTSPSSSQKSEPPDFVTTKMAANHPGIKIEEPTNRSPQYTHESCMMECQKKFGFAVFPATGDNQPETVPITDGQVVHDGHVCNCNPSQALLDKLKAANLDHQTANTYIKKSPTAAHFWLKNMNIKVELPSAANSNPQAKKGEKFVPSSKNAKGKAAATSSKGKKGVWPFKSGKGGTSKAP